MKALYIISTASTVVYFLFSAIVSFRSHIGKEESNLPKPLLILQSVALGISKLIGIMAILQSKKLLYSFGYLLLFVLTALIILDTYKNGLVITNYGNFLFLFFLIISFFLKNYLC